MCKYCEFTNVCESTGEKSNDIKRIEQIRDGSRILEVSINRYQNDDGQHRNELILEEAVDLNDLVYTVIAKHIEITYCPFCGEKL